MNLLRGSTSVSFLAVAILCGSSFVAAQTPPSSFPHVYPGQPSGDYSPQWQNYFEVTDTLPNVTFPLSRSFAGNIAVQRESHPNDTLFFWAVEKSNGSLTSNTSSDPWGIWLNGGPGSSSLAGFFFENGPIRIGPDYSASANSFSWDTVADYVWIDQPVGTGFSTADEDGYVADENQMGEDFMGFLSNLVKVFPSLATRPLHISGESYAGTYIPYILKTYFETSNPPVTIAKIAIGDGSIGSGPEFELLPAVTVIETYPQLIGYDPEVYQYFKEQSHLCGYDVNLTYPQNEVIPSLSYVPGHFDFRLSLRNMMKFSKLRSFRSMLSAKVSQRSVEDLRRRLSPIALRKRDYERRTWVQSKRDLTGRANGTIDTWYGCDLLDEFIDYAINFTFPWNLSQADGGSFDVYNIPDALSPEAPMDASVFLNDNRTRSALHAPTSKDWVENFDFPFGAAGGNDPSPEPMTFLTNLATNATSKSVGVVLYSGNDDSLIAHRGTEVVIQNTTFGGVQGFTRKPSTPWFDDSGNFAGIVHQERNWTYVLFQGAGHLVPAKQPENAAIFLREFVFGTNTTGLVTNDTAGHVNVVGGENSTLAADVLPGSNEIFYGDGTTQSSYVFPSATRAAWQSFIETATATAGGSTGVTAAKSNAAVQIYNPFALVTFCIALSILL